VRWLAIPLAMIGCGSPTSRAPASAHRHPMTVGECRVPVPVVLRCITPEQSPGEPYLLSFAGELEVIFKRAIDAPQRSLARSTDPHDARVSRRSGIRDSILNNNSFSLPCEDLPRRDGTYFIDLCPIETPAAACADSVPASGVGIADITDGVLALRAMAWGRAIQMSYSPSPEDPGCSPDSAHPPGS
jgi:hypothetical protein